jgi:hypothetical protein
MSHRWKKLGLLYNPTDREVRHPKLLSHAANPLPVHMKDDIYRIYYSGRDLKNRSSVGAVDVDIITRQIIQDHHDPFFVHGPAGTFYADGVSIGNCYEVEGKTYMLFMGWQTPEQGHWRGDIGRLTLGPDLSLSLEETHPFISTGLVDPVSLSYPWVLRNGLGHFEMWYGSTLEWDAGNGEMLHVLNHATSSCGHEWNRHGLAIPYELGLAQAFSRPTLANTNQMWFSYRSGTGQTYRIGYAEREEGEAWNLRLDKAGIDLSPSGWDSEMIEYPFVFDHQGKRYMLYNGNGYGKTGFGLAVMEQD